MFPLCKTWWHIWYLLQCPLVGFDSLTEARQRAMEWKVQLGVKFQPVIIGENEWDFERIDIAALFGISCIGGLDAGELEFPDSLLEESE